MMARTLSTVFFGSKQHQSSSLVQSQVKPLTMNRNQAGQKSVVFVNQLCCELFLQKKLRNINWIRQKPNRVLAMPLTETIARYFTLLFGLARLQLSQRQSQNLLSTTTTNHTNFSGSSRQAMKPNIQAKYV